MTAAATRLRLRTIFLTPDGREFFDAVSFARLSQLEEDADCVVALGHGDFVNVYASDDAAVDRVVAFINDRLGTGHVLETTP